MAIRKPFLCLLLCVVLCKNAGAYDGSSARVWKAPSLLNVKLGLRQVFPPIFAPPPPSPPPPPPPPPPPSSPPPPLAPAVAYEILVSSGSLDPSFNESVFIYTVVVDSSVYELQVSVTLPADEVEVGYALSINGTGFESGSSGPTLELANEGETVVIYVSVAALGYTSSLYTIFVTREESQSSGGGGLTWWQITLIVIACLVVVALIAVGILYWASRMGWITLASRNPSNDYQALS